MKDYYNILGVDKSASPEEIKRAFHKLAHKYHPSKGGDEKTFKEINEAYQILSNQEKRSQYDRFGTTFENGQPGGAGFDPGQGNFSWGWGNPFGQNQQGGEDGEEGPGFDFGNFSDIFEDLFGFNNGKPGANSRKNSKRGKDIRIDIEIPLEATLKGITKKISLSKNILCSRCYGSGAEPGSSTKECFSCRGTGEVQQIKRTILGSFTQWAVCPECNGEGTKPDKLCNVCKGEGRVKGEEEIEVNIPAGVDTNQIIKIAEKGEAGKRGGKMGDLYIRILVKKHPIFERNGDDLLVSADIPFSKAVLGGEIEIPILDGTKIILSVPQGTESGKVMKISGKGIPHFQGYGKGSLFVELVVKTPKKLTKRQKELMEEIEREGL